MCVRWVPTCVVCTTQKRVVCYTLHSSEGRFTFLTHAQRIPDGRSPCLLMGPKQGTNATSPLHPWGSPNKEGQNQNSVPRPCLLGGPKEGGNAMSPLQGGNNSSRDNRKCTLKAAINTSCKKIQMKLHEQMHSEKRQQMVPTPVALRRVLSWVPTPIALRQVHLFSIGYTHVWIWAPVAAWIFWGNPPLKQLAYTQKRNATQHNALTT